MVSHSARQAGTPAPGGAVSIEPRAIERIFRTVIDSVPGTTTVETKIGGFGRRKLPRVFAQADENTRMVAVEASIAATWPSPITQVAQQVRATIIAAAATYLDYKTTRVNVTVADAVAGPRVDIDSVNAPRTLATRTPAITSSVAQPRIPLLPSPPALRPVQLPQPPRPFTPTTSNWTPAHPQVIPFDFTRLPQWTIPGNPVTHQGANEEVVYRGKTR